MGADIYEVGMSYNHYPLPIAVGILYPYPPTTHEIHNYTRSNWGGYSTKSICFYMHVISRFYNAGGFILY